MSQRKSIILCGEENSVREISRVLAGQFMIYPMRTAALALARLHQEKDVQALIVEQSPSAAGFALLKSARETRPDVRRIVLTQYGDLTGIIGGLHSGVIQHLVQLPIRDIELLSAVCPVIPPPAASAHSFA